ncbi:hypothetical protein [Atopomonas hussainii]|uniref:hypothetical protein n=1 Tax=Atopomonas hussainii TaxID=1429083 RepID=UPI00111355EC|nr:hypothetical protein [Atopomonas hussainii]
MKHRIAIISVMALCIAALWLCGSQIYYSPLPLRVIDQDGSGILSISEILNARDVGAREVAGKPECIEYFWYKDGSPAFESCSGK